MSSEEIGNKVIDLSTKSSPDKIETHRSVSPAHCNHHANYQANPLHHTRITYIYISTCYYATHYTDTLCMIDQF